MKDKLDILHDLVKEARGDTKELTKAIYNLKDNTDVRLCNIEQTNTVQNLLLKEQKEKAEEITEAIEETNKTLGEHSKRISDLEQPLTVSAVLLVVAKVGGAGGAIVAVLKALEYML